MKYKFDVHFSGDREGVCSHITFECLVICRSNGLTFLMDGPEQLFKEDFLFDDYCLDSNQVKFNSLPKENGKLYKVLMEDKGVKYWTDCGYEYDSILEVLAWSEVTLNDVEINHEIKILK